MINNVYNKTELTNSNMTEDFETELMGFDQPSYSSVDLDDPENLSDEPFTEDLNNELEQELDEQPDTQEAEPASQPKSVSKNKKLGTMLVKVLRDEINNKKEFERDFLRFRYRGEVCDGVPMAEINPSRFVFKIDGILKGINLSEIKIL